MDLSVDQLSVTLAKKKIVKEISIKVKEKQFVGLIGPNGCGKSTLLRSIYKLLPPDTGSIHFGDMDIINSSIRNVAKEFAVVSQFNEISFDFTVQQMVMMGRTPHKKMLESDTKKDFELVEKALAQVELSTYREQNFLSLSGGEKQRVILARALVQKPNLFILDEPTNHLDIKHQLQILRIVKQLDTGVLAALHDIELAATYCDFLYAIKDGEVLASGAPEELVTKELMETLFEVPCEIYTNPITGKLSIAYL